jgi:regulator of Ty1 transposition protein 103
MTANYSVDTLKQKLDKLSHTQESIQMTCFWLNFHKKHLKESVQIWAEELAKQIPQRKLFFLYLANDLIQTAKKKQTGFDTAFQLVLPTCFEESFKFVHEEVKQKVGKILQVWKERRIYPEDFLMKLSNSIGLGIVND